jgi:hypothetical protein
MSGAAGSHDEAITLISDDETDHVAGTIGLNAEPEPEPDPSPERWGEYMKNKYMGQGLRDQRNKLNANIIRAMCLLIAPSMTLQGYFILLFCSETVDKDCPKARTGGASFAASRVLNISPDEQVEWMKDAEALFAREVPITWLPVLRPETFMTWLVAARRVHLRLTSGTCLLTLQATCCSHAKCVKKSINCSGIARPSRRRGLMQRPWSCCGGSSWTNLARRWHSASFN